jgi:predicted acetyltransferase
VTDDITISVPSADDWDAYYAASSAAFNEDGDEASAAAERIVFEPERSLMARRDGQIVGTAGIYTRQLSVPGAVVPAAHVTFVAVAVTARRRGVLTRFMRQQFADIAAAREPIAVLWASEGRIYQRFGYGLAARRVSLSVDTREVRLADGLSGRGRVREGAPGELRDALVKVYDQAYGQRPGWSERSSRNWDNRLADPEQSRHGGSKLRAVVHEDERGVDGYALWRVKGNWNEGGPAGEVSVFEHVATTPESYAALWRFLLTLDLTRTANAWHCAVDEPLQFMVNEPRRLGARLADALWVRLVDLPAALSARRYSTELDVVFEVSDAEIPANSGRWRVTGSPESARCVSTVEPADLAGDVRSLGAAYLGGTPLAALAAGGLVRELQPGALAAATAAFTWHPGPSAIEVF